MFKAKSSLFKKIRMLPNFDRNKMKVYDFDMYALHYLRWSDKCLYQDDDGHEHQVTPSSLVPILDNTWYISF